MFSISRRHAVGLVGGLLGATAILSRINIAAAAAAAPADAAFESATKAWLDGALRLNPVYATYIGDHRFDGEIDDVSEAGRAARVAFLKQTLSAFQAIDHSKLSRANQADAAILKNELRYELWDAEIFQSWAWDPLGYNELAGNAVYFLMAREFAPLQERLNHATERMEKLPTLLAQTRKALVPARVPLIHAQTVAKQNKGIGLIADGVVAQGAGPRCCPAIARAWKRRRRNGRRRWPNTRPGSKARWCRTPRAISALVQSFTTRSSPLP